MIRDAEVWVRPARDEDGFLPEGPRTITLGGRPADAWVNIQTAPDATAGAIFARYDDSGEVRRFDLPDRPGFFLPTDRPDTLLVGAGKSLLLFEPLTGAVEELARIPDNNPRTIVNDGELVPGGGAVVFGTKDTRFADPLAGLFLFTLADRQVTPLAGGMVCSNGKVLRRTGGGVELFDIDTPTRRIDRWRLDLPARRLAAQGVAVDLSAETGSPDGMCDAGDGTAIVAFYNPEPAPFGRAVRFDLTTGERLDEWRTPGSPRVTCPLLVRRPYGTKLVLTTATEGMPAAQRAACPAAGCLFFADAGGLTPPPAEVVRF